MKLLFDQNLSPRLADRLTDVYPDSTHVYLIGLDRSSDKVLWNYARDNGYVIVTKDADFNDLSVLSGFPPKVIWLRQGNCTIEEMEVVLRSNGKAIWTFEEDKTSGVLILL